MPSKGNETSNSSDKSQRAQESKNVVAVVLAWNHLHDTIECLASLVKTEYENFHIILVDNGSSDGTSEKSKAQYPTIEIVRIEENIGIARGYNRGIKAALLRGAQYVIILNNDTIVDPNMVAELVNAISNNPSAAMVMPKILLHDTEESRLWCAGAKWQNFPPRVKLIGANVSDGPPYDRFHYLEYAPSCCLLMTKESLSEVGLFDPAYYFYFDDWDLSERFRKHGYKILFAPNAVMWHKVSVTTQKSSKPYQWWFVMGESSVRFYLTHKSPFILLMNTLWFCTRELAKLKFIRVPPYFFGVLSGLTNHWGWRRDSVKRS